MPNWKKLITSGSSGSLAYLSVDTSIDATSFTGSLNFSNLTNTPTLLSSSTQIASNISGSITSTSSSIASDIASLVTFSSSLETTIYDYTGSFTGDGSGLSGISAEVSEQVTLSDSFTSATTHSVVHTFATKNLNVTLYDDNDDIFVPTRINTPTTSSVVVYMDPATTGRVVISKGGHIVSGSIATDLITSSTVSDTFTSSTTHSVAHTFGTKDVFVTVYNNNDDQFIPTRVSTPTTSSVIVYMDPATTGRVVVAKGGHLVSGSTQASVDFTVVSSSILPHTTEVFDLGSSDKRWRDLYLSGSTIDLGGTKITRDAATGDIEFKDNLDNRKSIKVDELQIGTGASARKIKVTDGKIKFTDTSDVVKDSDTANIIPESTNTFDLGSQSKQFRNLYLGSDLIVDTNTLYVNSSNNRVGIGTDSPSSKLDVSGSITATSFTGQNNLRQTVSIHTSDFTASLYSVSIISSSLSMSAPPSPEPGDWFKISQRVPSGSNFTSSLLFGNGSQIMSASTELELDVEDQGLEFIYADATQGWVLIGN